MSINICILDRAVHVNDVWLYILNRICFLAMLILVIMMPILTPLNVNTDLAYADFCVISIPLCCNIC